MKKVWKELKAVARTTAYFAIVFILLMVMKKLYLKDYDIEFVGLSQALIGALIMAKVILLMQLIPLGNWIQRQPPMVDVIIRTLLYTIGVAIVVLLEKGFENRHKADTYGEAVLDVFHNRDIYHVWATIIGVSTSILVYNCVSVIQMKMGKKGLLNLFFSGSLNKVEHIPTPDVKMN